MRLGRGFLFRLQAITASANRQFISCQDPSLYHRLAIDLNSVGTSEVAHDQAITQKRQNAMLPRDFAGFQEDVTFLMSTH